MENVDSMEEQLSPPVIDDSVPCGEHMITPKPTTPKISNDASLLSSQYPSIAAPASSTLFPGSPSHESPSTVPDSNFEIVDYFKDEECTIDTEVRTVRDY